MEKGTSLDPNGSSPLHPGMLRVGSSSSRVRERNKRNRSSAATVQTSTASNIIPVAYIPGVTTNLTKKNLRKGQGRGSRRFYQDSDRKSHITLGSSILGGDEDDDDELQQNLQDLNEEESGSFAGNNNNGAGATNNMTTAIRARPKLVQIDETAEEDEDENANHGVDQEAEEDIETEANETGNTDNPSHFRETNVQDNSIGHAGHGNESQQQQEEEQGQGQQGDIRHYRNSMDSSNSDSRDPFHTTVHSSSDSNSEGSFILDVEMASNHH